MATPLTLSAESARAFFLLAGDLRRILGPRFVALIAYGERTSLAFCESLTTDDLDAFGALVEAWHRGGLATPLFMTEDEFRRSLDAFPLEYQAILDRHVVIDGRSPLGEYRVADDDLRRACEVQARAHLLHLRQGWVEAGAHGDDDHEQAELVARSAAPLRALLMNVARLHNSLASTNDELAKFAEREAGMSAAVVRDVLALEGAAHPRREAARLLPPYLEAAGRLWAFVDAWKSHAR